MRALSQNGNLLMRAYEAKARNGETVTYYELFGSTWFSGFYIRKNGERVDLRSGKREFAVW